MLEAGLARSSRGVWASRGGEGGLMLLVGIWEDLRAWSLRIRGFLGSWEGNFRLW